MSSDQIDAACIPHQTARDMLNAVARIRAKTEELPSIGRCYNCHTPLDAGKYCDSECAEDFEQRRNAAKRAGRLM